MIRALLTVLLFNVCSIISSLNNIFLNMILYLDFHFNIRDGIASEFDSVMEII